MEHVRWGKRTTVEHDLWYKHAGAKIACVQADDRRMDWCDGRPPELLQSLPGPRWRARARSRSPSLMRLRFVGDCKTLVVVPPPVFHLIASSKIPIRSHKRNAVETS